MERYIEVEHLHIQYDGEYAVSDVSFTVRKGESVGLMGESGSGKSSIALALMGLLPTCAVASGVMRMAGMTRGSGEACEALRWDRVALVFQNSADVLNPLLTVGEQLRETMRRHGYDDSRERVEHYLTLVGLEARVCEVYPHELSGGMRQKVLIAMALCCEPECLIVDEPTMALDAVAKQEVVALLQKLQREGLTLVVISHELHILAQLVSRLYVLYAGRVVEAGETEKLLYAPRHPYTFGLVHASPSLHPFRDLWGIAGEMERVSEPRCAFYARCFQKHGACLQERPSLEGDGGHVVACVDGGIRALLDGRGVTKTYKRGKERVEACKDVDLTVYTGEVVALIGASGSGKSTLAMMLSGLLAPDAGAVTFQQEPLRLLEPSKRKYGVQHIFQDPFASIHEQLTVQQIVGEPLELVERLRKRELQEAVRQVLSRVGLPSDEAFLQRRGFQCSGGMRQRLAIARALTLEPKLLVADEMTAMLDPSTAANILRLLKELQVTLGFSMLFVTHDLALAQKVADRVVVMKDGALVESGCTTNVLMTPQHAYTRSFVASMFRG